MDLGRSVLSAAPGCREASQELPQLQSTLSGRGNHSDDSWGGRTLTLGAAVAVSLPASEQTPRGHRALLLLTDPSLSLALLSCSCFGDTTTAQCHSRVPGPGGTGWAEGAAATSAGSSGHTGHTGHTLVTLVRKGCLGHWQGAQG